MLSKIPENSENHNYGNWHFRIRKTCHSMITPSSPFLHSPTYPKPNRLLPLKIYTRILKDARLESQLAYTTLASNDKLVVAIPGWWQPLPHFLQSLTPHLACYQTPVSSRMPDLPLISEWWYSSPISYLHSSTPLHPIPYHSLPTNLLSPTKDTTSHI